jgi:putative ABC transport system ATP-binding protein
MNTPESIPPDPSPAVRLTGIEKSFGMGSSITRALRHTDFEARRGEMMFLVGPSGCGKTTLLSILAGTLRADAGEVVVYGQALHDASESERTAFRMRHLGFIFQQFNLIPSLSILENVSVPLVIQGKKRSEAESRAADALGRVGLGDRLHERPGKLSGGQQQRVAIARALVHDPPLIVCDEPTSALDRENGRRIMELLRDAAAERDRTVIIVTHDPRIYSYADRMAEMEDGRISRLLDSPSAIAAAHPDN